MRAGRAPRLAAPGATARRAGAALLALAALALAAPAADAATCATGATPSPYHPDAVVVDPAIAADGTAVPASLHLPPEADAGAPVPAVLMTHGGGSNRFAMHSNPELGQLFDDLIDANYAVLTWDTRGHGQSSGTYRIGDPAGELADVEALVSYLAGCDEILREAPGDPFVGWAGISNGGGIQLLGAANDAALHDPPRIDAIAPAQFWGATDEDFFPSNVPTETFHWLYRVGYGYPEDCSADPSAADTTVADEIHDSFCESLTNNVLPATLESWWHDVSTTLAAPDVEVPTLLVQGTPDTGAPLGNALDVYTAIKSQPSPPAVRLVATCHGHGGCPYVADSQRWRQEIVTWMNRHVLGVPNPSGLEVMWQAQDGEFRAAASWPLPPRSQPLVYAQTLPPAIAANNRIEWPPPTGTGATGGDSNWQSYFGAPAFPVARPAPSGEVTNPLATPPVIGSALRARVLDQPPADRCHQIFGRPRIRLTGAVTGDPALVFLELQETGGPQAVTLDQVALPLRLAGAGPGTTTAFDVEVALHAIAWVVRPGRRLRLEISTASDYYWDGTARPAYSVRVDSLTATYPAGEDLVYALGRCT